MSMAGFKSFADRTSFKLGGQITAVVGPNGCGKSNIVDAVRWVMGESRASQMRQGTSYDMIFNGSGKRKAADLCSVEMHLSNDGSRDLGMWKDYAEISVRRSLERDGDSAYFINGQRVRRRDVVDLFAGTGIGARSYGVVEQEQITRIVQAEPKRIRGHLEEVAGVATYKERRKETERRIDTAQTNLARLEDIVAELTRQMEALARQAKQTVRVRKYKQELDLLQRFEMLLRTEELLAAGKEATAKMAEFAKQLDAAKARVTAKETALKELRSTRQTQNDRLGELQAKHYGTQAKLEQLRSSEREFDLRFEQEQAKLTAAQQTIAEQETAGGQLEQEIATLVTRVADLVAQVATKEKENDRLLALFEQAQATSQAKTQAQLTVAEKLAAQTGLLQQAQAKCDLASQRLADVTATLDASKQELHNLAPAQVADDSELVAAKESAKQAAAAALAMEQQRQRRSDELAIAKEDLLSAQARLGGLHAEQELLEGLAQKAQERQASYQSWLTEQGINQAKLLTEVTNIQAPGLEAAVDAVLERFVDGFVVDDYQHLAAATNQPKGLVLVTPPPKTTVVPTNKTGLELLSAKISVASGWEGFLAVALAGVYLAPDLPTALAAQSKLAPGERIVTPAGQILSLGMLATPPSKEVGMAWEARRHKVSQEITALEQEIATAKTQVEQLSQHYAQDTEQGKALASKRLAADQQVAKLQAEFLRAQHAFEFYGKQQHRLNETIAELTTAVAGREQDFHAAEANLATTTTAFEKIQQEVAAAKQVQSKASASADTARTAHNQLEIELRDLRLTINHEQQREQDLHGRLATLQHSLQESRDQANKLQQQLASMSKQQLAKQIKHAIAEESKAKTALEVAQAEATKLASAETKLEHELLDAKTTEENLARDYRELELDANTKAAEAKVAQTQLAEHGGPPVELETEELREKYPTPAAARDWLEKLRRKIENAGPINYAADVEHAECETRMQATNAQIQDLQTALASLNAAIERIDTEMLERLRNVFEEVNQRFNRLFGTLFDGGSARLELVGQDLLADGIVLKANPPGKKVATITALSGGEKTLTALAFLFALNELNPPPFCILDEVDAALDDANTRRFCRLIDSMRAEAQFVLITHNKAVLESIDHLVGVTQEEKGVSKLVAVKVEEAVANAQAAGGS